MPTINILDKKIYNRIAAGEVVERPFSVIKELIENALDAGATQIDVTIENGGKTLMRVADNGCGISSGDMVKAFLPHATSKIKNVVISIEFLRSVSEARHLHRSGLCRTRPLFQRPSTIKRAALSSVTAELSATSKHILRISERSSPWKIYFSILPQELNFSSPIRVKKAI